MATDLTPNYNLKKPDYTEDADIYDINDNMDTIDTALKGHDTGKKNVQTAVSDPTASGTGITFIKSISQNTQGVINPAKGTVREMSGANGTTAGSSGLVPAPAATDNGKFLRGDKTWATPTNTDTKNTAGSTDTSSKIFLVGATSQAANPQTYSHDTAYVGTDGCLYSGGAKVLTAHQSISGKKNTQSAVTDPSASGTSDQFIATITQDAQGVITPTKKTVRTMTGATSSADGATGLVPKPPKGGQSTKYLRADGTWQVPPDTTTDTKNTAGSTDSSSKLFLIGATSQAANPQTYSHDTAYVGTDGCLYSGGTKVLTAHQSISGKKNTQTAVNDPSADGTSATFIATISQNAQGVITPTKKTVRTMGAASSSAAGSTGLVPAPAKGDQGKYLRGDGTWQTPSTGTDTKNTAGATDTSSKIFLIGATAQDANPQTYSQDTAYVGTDGCLYSGGTKVLTAHQSISGKKNTQSAVSDPTANGTSVTFIATISQNAQGVITPTKKTVSTMGGATSSANGAAGLVPAPQTGNRAQYLRGDGTWATPTNTTYSDFTAATASAAGAHGLVPAPAAGDQAKFLRGDKTWAVPTDTKNTAGSTNTTGKIFLIGANSQATNPITYSNSNVYAQGGILYSGGKQVALHETFASYVTLTSNQTISGAKTFSAPMVISNNTEANSTAGGALNVAGGIGVAKSLWCGGVIHGTVANDYAEYRKAETKEPGRVVRESISGVMVKTRKRMERGCKVISDTFGFAIGETDEAKTPIGVTGRVLAYPARDRRKFKLGAPVCSGPDGTVDVMSRFEAILHPECIIGTVSEIPTYEKWTVGTKKTAKEIDVDGRIWIYVR